MNALISALDPQSLLRTGGYVLLFAIVFAESGLLVGFFLPGDSLLFVAGMAAAGTLVPDGSSRVHMNIWFVLAVVAVAAVSGDQVGYVIGSRAGPALFRRPDSRMLRREHLGRSEQFFERHGPRSIVLARFVPVVRTFCPVIAGASNMPYRTFVRFNIVGAVMWGVGVTSLGYFLGNIALIRDHIELALIAVVAISLVPIGVEFLRRRRTATKTTTN